MKIYFYQYFIVFFEISAKFLDEHSNIELLFPSAAPQNVLKIGMDFQGNYLMKKRRIAK